MKFKQILFTALVAIISAFGAVGLYDQTVGFNEVVTYSQSYQPIQFASYPNFTELREPSEPVNFTFAASLTTPAVVHVRTFYDNSNGTGKGIDVFKDLFGDDFQPYWYDDGYGREASGSGVIISSDGYIVTNYHVIKNASDIEIAFFDKKAIKAKLIGSDPSTDLALLKVESENLPYMAFGNSDSLMIGEWVLAVGNPFDLTSTVTAGIVSAKGRKIDILRNQSNLPAIESFIQTDAAVNPGNSGGALVNTRGELIGINTAIATSTGSYAGYSFAVPVNIVKKVIRDLMEFGIVQRAFLGVQIDVSKEGLGGVYIDRVQDGSGSFDAGLKSGDIITQVNGINILSFPELQEQISKYSPGDEVMVNFVRDGNNRSVPVTLKNANKNTSAITRDIISSLGMDLKALSEEELQQYEISAGLEVSSLADGIVDQQTKIKKGFIITSVDGQVVSTPEEFTNIINEMGTGIIIIEGFYPSYPYKKYNYPLELK